MGCRILAGKVYVQDLAVADQPLLFIGNAQLGLAISEEEQSQPDYTSSAGGNACSIKTITKVEAEFTFYDFDARNLALACFGTAESIEGDAVAAELINAFADGALNKLEHIPTVGTVVVESVNYVDPTPGPEVGTRYVEDTDYTVTGAGFIVIADSDLDDDIQASITGDPKYLALQVNYSYGDEDSMDALTTSGKNFRVVVDGKNRAAGNAPEVWDIYSAVFGPTDSLNIITRDFGSFNSKAEIVADTSKPEGEGQYFIVKRPTPV